MKQMKLWNAFNFGMSFLPQDKFIESQIKKNKDTVYGARAIKKHIGFFARDTQDWDVLSNKPRQQAVKLEKELDKKSGGNFYFVKPAMHPGTWKVKHKGKDMKPNTDDDLEVADFTKPNRKVKTVRKDGIRYVQLSEVVKDKKTSLADKEYAFRHKKDKDDLDRIKAYNKFKKYRI